MSSTRGIALVLCALSLGACAPQIVVRDRMSACRVARSVMRQPLSPADLIEVTAIFPRANAQARRAYHTRMAALVLTGIGGAALVGAFVTGFALDTSKPDARTALYATVGGTIGLGAGALLAGFLSLKAKTAAYTELDDATRAECP